MIINTYLLHILITIDPLKVPMKRIFIFDICVDKRLKIKFLFLKFNIMPFITLKPQSNMMNLLRQIQHGQKYAHNSL